MGFVIKLFDNMKGKVGNGRKCKIYEVVFGYN